MPFCTALTFMTFQLQITLSIWNFVFAPTGCDIKSSPWYLISSRATATSRLLSSEHISIVSCVLFYLLSVYRHRHFYPLWFSDMTRIICSSKNFHYYTLCLLYLAQHLLVDFDSKYICCLFLYFDLCCSELQINVVSTFVSSRAHISWIVQVH